jgi:hypothetical protein
MKRSFTLIALFFSLAALAQEVRIPENKVPLEAETVKVDATEALVVRTNKTPELVEIFFNVRMSNQICEQYETRLVMRASGAQCGYNTTRRRVRTGTVCTRTNPYNNECVNHQDTWREELIQIPRTCMVPETVCGRYGTVYTSKSDSMKISFKKLPALGDSESETFSIVAEQKGYDKSDIIYHVNAVETLREYKIAQKKILFFKLDAFVVEEK